jgi:hypothetical protein
MFEYFYEYINDIYGNLKLKLRVSRDALVWCCVDPLYSLLHGFTTSFLESVSITVGSNGNTKQMICDVPILKQCADNFSIKSVNDVYTKKFTQLNSYGRACNNILAGGNGEIEKLTNNLVGLCSYDYTNVTLICLNWEVTKTETIVAGYNINETVLSALKSILKKDQ